MGRYQPLPRYDLTKVSGMTLRTFDGFTSEHTFVLGACEVMLKFIP